ncbi:class I SAM-dependent methyltransferase [bacterium]|nr:class I SAM-dependent methyltransferase [bacterium]
MTKIKRRTMSITLKIAKDRSFITRPLWFVALCSLTISFSIFNASSNAWCQTLSAADLPQTTDVAPTDPEAEEQKTSSATLSDQPAKRAERPRPQEDARKTYQGRVLAKPMSHLGASWLVREERDQEENASLSFQQLKLEPGMTVCDLGCGNGYWTIPMAKKVGAEGKVLAVDIQKEMLIKLRERSARFNFTHIEPIRSTVDDPKLPANEVDLLLMVDVYHEFSHPESMLWGIRRSLKPTGVVALLEYREEDPRVPIKPLHKMSKTQILKEYRENGFKLVREFNSLPWQHLMFFARDDSPLKKIEAVPTQQVLEELE